MLPLPVEIHSEILSWLGLDVKSIAAWASVNKDLHDASIAALYNAVPSSALLTLSQPASQCSADFAPAVRSIFIMPTKEDGNSLGLKTITLLREVWQKLANRSNIRGFHWMVEDSLVLIFPSGVPQSLQHLSTLEMHVNVYSSENIYYLMQLMTENLTVVHLHFNKDCEQESPHSIVNILRNLGYKTPWLVDLQLTFPAIMKQDSIEGLKSLLQSNDFLFPKLISLGLSSWNTQLPCLDLLQHHTFVIHLCYRWAGIRTENTTLFTNENRFHDLQHFRGSLFDVRRLLYFPPPHPNLQSIDVALYNFTSIAYVFERLTSTTTLKHLTLRNFVAITEFDACLIGCLSTLKELTFIPDTCVPTHDILVHLKAIIPRMSHLTTFTTSLPVTTPLPTVLTNFFAQIQPPRGL
ncbi:hypothetical protein BDP27DRAFT_1413480 [Rhodocollybia butyracea]|uniref:F-box domain-containing protein n=1 Tax=Rhodocollybia butyracea TaxID=206335 RepID=A0A9P5UFZ2_9AGAR|nr:hypothetical protein BDP27DRAFT_1413480 [Rhodocollybia butyracea]